MSTFYFCVWLAEKATLTLHSIIVVYVLMLCGLAVISNHLQPDVAHPLVNELSDAHLDKHCNDHATGIRPFQVEDSGSMSSSGHMFDDRM